MSSVITALLSGLRNHGFRASLSKKPTESMTELLWRGEEYIDQEEVLRATRCDREVYDSGNKKTRRDEPSTIRQNIKNSTDYIYRPRHDLVHAISQIQLNAPLSDILQEISTLKELQWPEKLRSDPSIRDRGRMCEFHKDHGHTTDQCRTLRSEVERLVSEGLLKTGGGDSRNSRKGYARSLQVNSISVSSRFGRSVTFDDDDLEGVSLPHDDALVITGDIADFDVRRVLVDTGSAANVMSWEAFKGLKIPTDRLKSVNTPLQGFGGGTVIPEGIVDLPVVLGQHPYSVTLITPFLIVNTPMAYNSIYGRPIINSAGAIISTQHQCMKFPMGRGISIIRGDQLTSRRCYIDNIRHETHPTMLMIEIDEFPQAQRFEPAEEVETVEVAEGKKVSIG
ncbi:Retrotrans gag domain-containing protein [Abeliophyllum distichum]|uniref:Retrotrans gag domain-containing protein n=1 Tax=Abeliophyllum distichum TaxID=126358 RepID=A0ABD1V6C2_9LAMI